MISNPVDVALQHVSETKHLLDILITSSESFDYPRAKLTLKVLQRKTRELERLQSELLAQARIAVPANVVVLPRPTA